MGLDMYLYAKQYIPSWDEEGKALGSSIQEKFPEFNGLQTEFNGPVIKYVTAEVGYWRKANAIHKWFVENIQEGKDDCGCYAVEREELERLRALCMEVLANPAKASSVLPTTSGFFFGSTDYGEWYLTDIQNTVKIIDQCLTLPYGWQLEYHSSW